METFVNRGFRGEVSEVIDFYNFDWKNSSDGRILKSDVTIAKNYLSEAEIRSLEGAVI